ncbi:MAG: hypothetical protein V3W11_07065, partial [bacterium]
DLTTLEVQLDQPSADFKAVTTQKSDFSIGVNFLENFFKLFAKIPGLGGIGAAFNAGFKGAASVEMTYAGVVQDFIDPMDLTPLVEDKACGEKVYEDLQKRFRKERGSVVIGCLKSNAFSVRAFDDKGTVVAPEISVFDKLVSGKVGVECHKEAEAAVAFQGEVPQLFAVKALKVKLTDKGKFKILGAVKRMKDAAPGPQFSYEEFPEEGPVVIRKGEE